MAEIITPDDLAAERVEALQQSVGLPPVAQEDYIPVGIEVKPVDRGQFGGGPNNGPSRLSLAIGVALGLITTRPLVSLLHSDIFAEHFAAWIDKAAAAAATGPAPRPYPEIDPACQPGAHWSMA